MKHLVRQPDTVDVTLPPPEVGPITDQHGRLWEPWRTLIPGACRECAKCGRHIDAGLMLAGSLRPTRYAVSVTVLCTRHVKQRWV